MHDCPPPPCTACHGRTSPPPPSAQVYTLAGDSKGGVSGGTIASGVLRMLRVLCVM